MNENKINDIIELANFIVTAAAFGAAIYAIYYQHQHQKAMKGNIQHSLILTTGMFLVIELK